MDKHEITSERQARNIADSLLAQMKGPGWKSNIMENPNGVWHVEVTNGPLTILRGWKPGASRAHYTPMMSRWPVDMPGTGETIWDLGNQTYTDPNVAAVAQLCKALEVTIQMQAAVHIVRRVYAQCDDVRNTPVDPNARTHATQAFRAVQQAMNAENHADLLTYMFQALDYIENSLYVQTCTAAGTQEVRHAS